MPDVFYTEGTPSVIISKEEKVSQVVTTPEPSVHVIKSIETGPQGLKGDKGDPGDPDDIDLHDLTILFENRLI